MTNDTLTRKKLTARDGMYLTDGDIFAKDVYPASDMDEGMWREITEAEYQSIMAERADLSLNNYIAIEV